MYCISVSYKSANLQLRQKLSFNTKTKSKITSEMCSSGKVTECVLLCTCNRTEVYFCGEKGSDEYVVNTIANYAGVPADLLTKHLLFYYDDNATKHLFKVACGIDSMVVGEDEILGQTRNAYMTAKEENTTAYELNMIFQSAFACAKRIKTDTALSRTSVSVATLASNEAVKFGRNILVIGSSGNVGTTVLKNLISHKDVTVKATLRHHNSRFSVIENLGIDVVDYKDRYKYINEADCIISATSSPHYTITYYDLKKYINDEKQRLFIDLAVPADIDSFVTKIKDTKLINIDYFEQLARENNIIKLDSVSKAKEIIDEELNSLKKDLLFHDLLPLLDKVKNAVENKPLEELIYKMKSTASATAFEEFINVLKTL